MNRPFRVVFRATVCGQSHQLKLGFAFGMTLFVLTLLSIPFTEPGTGAFVLSRVNLGVSSLALILFGGTLAFCKRTG